MTVKPLSGSLRKQFVIDLIFVSAFALVSVLPVFSQPIPSGQWRRFSSNVAGLSVLFPDEPHESISEPQSSPFYVDGMKLYSASVGTRSGYFVVIERIYPTQLDVPADISRNLDQFQSFAVSGLNGAVVSQRDLKIQELPARRVTVSFAMGKDRTQQEMFVLKGHRLFQLMVTGASPTFAEADVDRFFNSFEVIGEPKEWKRSRSDPSEVVEKDDPEPAQVTTGVTAFKCPTYPPSAKQMRLSGMVEIQVTTNGEKITDLKVRGHPILAQAATENLRTWRFADSAPRSFKVKYFYNLEGDYEPDPVFHCPAKLKLPETVEVSAEP